MNRREDIFDAWDWRVARGGLPRHDCVAEACNERLRYACWLARPIHPIGKRCWKLPRYIGLIRPAVDRQFILDALAPFAWH
jgi:hypothetical protein